MAAIVFSRSTSQYSTFEKRYDSNGKVWMEALMHGDLVAKTVYKVTMNEYGTVTEAQADDTDLVYLGVPENALSSGAVDWLQIGGYIVAMITPSLSVSVGHALKMDGGAIADAAADFSGAASEFACNTAATSSAEIHTVILCPELILATT